MPLPAGATLLADVTVRDTEWSCCTVIWRAVDGRFGAYVRRVQRKDGKADVSFILDVDLESLSERLAEARVGHATPDRLVSQSVGRAWLNASDQRWGKQEGETMGDIQLPPRKPRRGADSRPR